jgi:iron complex transport system substrate-binding protein
MRRVHGLIIGVIVVAGAATGLRVRSQLSAVRDDEGVEVSADIGSLPAVPHDYPASPWVHPDERESGPERIISLAPSITEIVCALGLRDRLVGRTQYCRYPPSVQSVEPVGALTDTNLERIRALEPDVILTTMNSGPLNAQLEALGMPAVSVPHDSLDEVYAAIERIGAVCRRPRTAAALVGCLKTDLAELTEWSGSHVSRPKRVLIALGPLPVPPQAMFVAGPDLFLDGLLRRAGHVNAAGDVLSSSSGELPLEKLLALEVDAILTFGPPLDESDTQGLYRSWSELSDWPPIRARQVHRAGSGEWLSAGPRVAILLHRMITVLSPPD